MSNFENIVPMNADEMKSYRIHHDVTRIVEHMPSASEAEKQALIDYAMRDLAKKEQDAANADKFRPSYAPAGRLTREQRDSRIMLKEAQEFARFVVTVI